MSFDLRRRVVQEDPWDVSHCNIIPTQRPTAPPNASYICIRPPSLLVALNAFGDRNQALASMSCLLTKWAVLRLLHQPRLRSQMSSHMRCKVLTNWCSHYRLVDMAFPSRQNEKQGETSKRKVKEDKEAIERKLDPSLVCTLGHRPMESIAWFTTWRLPSYPCSPRPRGYVSPLHVCSQSAWV